ncbi:hypothetical protein [Streptomyces sp. NPDC047061]|uniref:hypothetical protein n=1 Tax=Streptomyces sp. NPDC047061 TaxID=3154605 RepID=UPI0033C47C95
MAVLGKPDFGHTPREASPLCTLWRGTGRPASVAPANAGGADDDTAVVTAQDNAGNMLPLNPPNHTRLRRLVSRALTPASVQALMPRIEAITNELVRDLTRASTSSTTSRSRCRSG